MQGKPLLPLLMSVLLAGCGSLHTVRSDETLDVRHTLLNGTYCDSIPRVYSGVVYDLCWLHGSPYGAVATDSAGNVTARAYRSDARYSFGDPIWALADMLVSGITDTFALPYTLYRQNRDGSIQLVRD
ncbi:YceK/YidQ family lipoprotein [Pseudomonas panipatensis]|uniref:YceK/YidQ family lipoprotein n=1 Tax=Pseudomonas panipatensis TaxID=428992 RepID=A0A1G8E1Y6_9PSED|nr:YceK/YidQ family lipoprotein [Pseudomonas panipatensis]SDH63923.1 Protein of unknown function [Pseudomonas panipatensis]SMP38841.1 Protein of unknown function [Pseudomonas panipatensis]